MPAISCNESLNDKESAAEKLFFTLRNDRSKVTHIVEEWTELLSKFNREFSKPDELSNEEVFSEVYHSLIHSQNLQSLLNLEEMYAKQVVQLSQKWDKDHKALQNNHVKEMEAIIEHITESGNSQHVNLLSQSHMESEEINLSRWASELSSMHESQKREYKLTIMNIYQNTHSCLPEQVGTLPSVSPNPADEQEPVYQNEESFTINLGAQLKTMHNLRLFSGSPTQICQQQGRAQHLQTAMSLYSSDLSALVLLVDNRFQSNNPIQKAFESTCEQSTELHFKNLQQQLESVDQIVRKCNATRSCENMKVGDVYLTRHSNLCNCHMVFHLVVDDGVSQTTEISSRHPIILGYRNVLKACFHHDVTVITLPLLLTHCMAEHMTINWCLKRAELVFKCVKGFLMELATWSAQKSHTIQFQLPPTLSPSTFASISALLPTIFRMSNPVTS